MTLRSTINAILFAATAAMAPAPLLAQITTFVAPPRKAATDSAKAAVATTAAQRDTLARMSLGNMKAWVDSAAGVGAATTQVAVADTSSMPAPQPTTSTTSTGSRTSTFSNGAIAPNTASPLPFYAVSGLVLIFLGIGTLRVAQVRSTRRRRDG